MQRAAYSQLFNTPNLSASAYTAESDPEKCVACGKCVETCPADTVRLGQKLCTKEGPIQYPRHELPDDTKWGEDHWNKNYRNENGSIQTWPTGTAPCKVACPAHIAIQGYIKMAADGRYADALKLIKKDNPFPVACGSICRKYCEDACTRGTIDQPLAIDEIKKFIAEQDMKAEHRYVPPMNSCTHEKFDQKIAIIGAGPAGMSCAYFLAIEGYSPVVFEKEAAPGGMLVNGIPTFRVGKDIVKSEIDVLREMGVEFRCGVEVGRDVTIHRNLREFKELDKENVTLPAEKIKKPARCEVVIDKNKALTMCDDRVTFTEEQIKSEASRCLSCGRSVVDPNKCIGCGICTTKCEFDAIHLKRNRPQNSKMIPAEDKFKAIGPYAAKRQVKIIKKQLSGK